MKTSTQALLFSCCALALTACGGGGGGGSESDEKAPTSLFPPNVLTGTVEISGPHKVKLTVTYNSSDTTQGSSYTARITFPKGEEETVSGTNMRQTGESEPGHLVFYFDDIHTRPMLYGRMVLDLPAASGSGTSRRGSVEASTQLEYLNDKGEHSYIYISGGTVDIQWNNVN